MEFHLYLPQMRMSPDQLVERARAAEAAGFLGVAGMDHMAPPGATTQPMLSAMTTNTWLAAHTSRMIVSSLVLCDWFRHPVTLAQEAVSLDHLSGGRFELGIGWGSLASELETFGFSTAGGGERVARLKETLEILRAMWSGESVDYDGRFFTLRGAHQALVPLDRIPIVIGGGGPKTMELVATYADWWNVHIGILHRLDEMRSRAGNARVSVEHMIGFVPSEGERERVTELATRRFGTMGVFLGNSEEIIDFVSGMKERGVERIYAWFTDFADPDTLAAFGETVIPACR